MKSGTPEKTTAEKTLKRRLNYLTHRSAEILARIGVFAEEREMLGGQLREAGDGSGGNLRAMRSRRTYLADRIEALRAEQKQVTAERREVIQTLSAAKSPDPSAPSDGDGH